MPALLEHFSNGDDKTRLWNSDHQQLENNIRCCYKQRQKVKFDPFQKKNPPRISEFDDDKMISQA